MTTAILFLAIMIVFLILKYDSLKEPQIHAFYVSGVLLLGIILLITVRFGGNEKLVDYVNFAATLASLILAVLAIIYAVYSNYSFSGNIKDLNDASKKITNETNSMRDATGKLIEEIRNQNKGMRKMSANFSKQTRQTQVLLEKGIQSTAINFSNNKLINIEDLIVTFLKNSSLLGLMVLYAIKLSEESKKNFNLKNFTDTISFAEYNYIFGFLIATSSLGAISFTSENEVIIVTQVNEYLKVNIYKILEEKARNFDIQYPGPANAVEEIEKIKKLIQKT